MNKILNHFITLIVFLCLICHSAISADTNDSKVSADIVRKRKILIHMSLLNIYSKQGKTKKCIEEYASLISLVPENSKLRHGYGLSYFKLGNYDLALDQLKKAEELDPKNLNIKQNILNIYQLKRDMGNSHKYFWKIRKLQIFMDNELLRKQNNSRS